MSGSSSACPSTDAGESAAAPATAAPAAAAPSGAWGGPAEGPTVGVQVLAGLLPCQQFVWPLCFGCCLSKHQHLCRGPEGPEALWRLCRRRLY